MKPLGSILHVYNHWAVCFSGQSSVLVAIVEHFPLSNTDQYFFFWVMLMLLRFMAHFTIQCSVHNFSGKASTRKFICSHSFSGMHSILQSEIYRANRCSLASLVLFILFFFFINFSWFLSFLLATLYLYYLWCRTYPILIKKKSVTWQAGLQQIVNDYPKLLEMIFIWYYVTLCRFYSYMWIFLLEFDDFILASSLICSFLWYLGCRSNN